MKIPVKNQRKLPHVIPLAVPIFLLFVLACTPGISFSEDLGRHLLLGKLILKNLAIPDTNFLAYTYPDFPFINHHWLSQVLLYLFHSWIGLNGLIVLKMLLMSLTLGISLTVIKTKRHAWLIWLTGIFSALVLVYRAHIRPELFSFIFVALLMLIFEKYRRGNKKVRWLILPIMLIWCNAHIYFIFGLGMIGAFAIENWLKKRKQQIFRNEAIWVIATFFVCLFNPYGLKGLLFPFHIFDNYGVDITENASPLTLWETSLNPMLITLPFLSLLTLWAICFNLYQLKKVPKKKTFKNIRVANLIIATAALVSAWIMARNTPLMAISALPVIITAINRLPEFQLKNIYIKRCIATIFYGVPACCSIFLLLMVLNGSFFRIFPSPTGPTPFGFDPNPERWNSISELIKTDPDDALGNVFSDYNIGSLVEYQLYPQKGYVDNRPEAFPDKFWKEEYFPAMSDLASFDKTVLKRDIDWAIYSLTSIQPGLIPTLCQNNQWVLIHLDENAIILIKNTLKNQTAIKKLKWDKNRASAFERDISERLLNLPNQPWYYRQVEADILLFRLYALVCIGEQQRAWPYIWQMHLIYPDYQAVHELMRITAPQVFVPQIEPIYASRARWPLSAKQVSDWANHLKAQGKNKQALETIKRGRIFFPLSQILKNMENRP